MTGIRFICLGLKSNISIFMIFNSSKNDMFRIHSRLLFYQIIGLACNFQLFVGWDN